MACILATTLILIALHPETQQRIHAELDSHSPSHPYLTACLMESSRLYPPIASINRLCTADAVLPTSASSGEAQNVFVPRGSELLVNLRALHRIRKLRKRAHSHIAVSLTRALPTARHWGADVDDFSPERFLNARQDRLASAAPEAFVGFGSGAVAESYAEGELHLLG